MAIKLKKIITIEGNYSEKEKAILAELISMFRITMSDDDATKNILNNHELEFADTKIIKFFERATKDINSGQPRTKFSLFQLAEKEQSLLLNGAMIFALMAQGMLHLKNQVDFSDSGLSIAMFNKSPLYQGWISFLLQTYIQDKAEFKSAHLVNEGSLFFGIHSEFGYWAGEERW